MADQRTARREASEWDIGVAVFAGIMMIMIGFFEAMQGLAAILKDDFYVVTQNYSYKIDVTAWGWIHLFLGIIVAIAGVYVIMGKLWARVIGISLAVISAVANFFFIPYYPFWSLLIIALCVFVIRALAVYRGEEAMP